MKNKFLVILFLLILSFEFSSCTEKPSSGDPVQLLALAFRAAKLIADSRDNVVLQGTVNGPGSIKNATVQIYPTPTNGQCAKDDGTINGTPIASATSDDTGFYSLKYKKTGSTVCVVVTPTGSSQIQVFSPTTRTNVPTAWSKGNLMAVIKEPTNSSNGGFTAANKTVNVNPFTRMAARRFSALSAINPSSRSRVFLRIVPYSARGGASSNDKVEFGNNSASTLLDKAEEDIENAFFPNRDKATFSLESADPESNAMKLKLGTIGITADKLGGSAADGKTSSDDLEKVINFMEEDFSDGKFNGKKVDENGKIAVMNASDFGGVVASKQAADDFLKKDFKAAQTEYDSYDTSLTAATSDQLFCESDSLDAACSIAVLPGSAPEMWIFNQDEDFVDIGDTYDHQSVGFGTGGTASTRYYVIVNGGGSELKLTLPITFSGSEFTVVEQPDAVVAGGDATYFAVKFVPSSASAFSRIMTVASNDTLYSPYTVTLTGTGIDLATNLRLYWAFNGNANDSSGNGLNGAVNSGASLTADIFGVDNRAYNFDGSTTADIANATGVNLSTGAVGSFSAWVSPTDISSGTFTFLSQGTQFGLQFDSDSIVFFVDPDSSTPVTITLGLDPDLFVGSWNLITGVYNDSGDLVLYINGEEVSRTTIATATFDPAVAFVAGNDGSSSSAFSGDIDDVRVYRSALSSAQVAALYNQD